MAYIRNLDAHSCNKPEKIHTYSYIQTNTTTSHRGSYIDTHSYMHLHIPTTPHSYIGATGDEKQHTGHQEAQPTYGRPDKWQPGMVSHILPVHEKGTYNYLSAAPLDLLESGAHVLARFWPGDGTRRRCIRK